MTELYFGDCLEIMPKIRDKSVGLVFADLPYGTTKCKWDVIIPFPQLWKEYERIGNDNCIYLFTSNQPFTSVLVQSNLDLYRYELVWEKTRNSHPFFAKKRPLPQHETIQVFSKKESTVYNPQMIVSDNPYKINRNASGRTDGENSGKKWDGKSIVSNSRYPHSVIRISNPASECGLHPTQKPLELMEYLIKTYSLESDTVLDNVMGSGTTGVAAKRLNRNFIGIEKDERYYKVAKERIEND